MAETSQPRVAFVTGASRGIGRAIAIRLASDGRHVALCSRSESPLQDLKSEIEAIGGSASVVTADVSKRDELAQAIESVADQHGRLDVLVNNAGITKDTLLLRMSDADWDDVISTNLSSVFVACRAAARPMMRNKFGRIINIASTSGVIGNAGQANYAAAKSGLLGFTKTIARELGSKGITANTIAPGFIETDMTKNLGEAVTDAVKSNQAVRSTGQPEDIAAAASYLSSDEASFVTGQTLCVDGGLTMC